MNEAQEKRVLIKAFNVLESHRTRGHLTMAVYLWRVNGLQCALDFLAKMREYEQTEEESEVSA